jgi:citrate/tricarballylate utilization protein
VHSLEKLIEESQRQLRICNACRYCEGFCAVFPALERRLEFTESDVHYLANLCHNCGACLYACQYAPPHEFNLNFPRTLAEVRKQTYRKYAWPSFLGVLFEKNGIAAGLITAASLAVMFLLSIALTDSSRLFAAHSDATGSFYAVIPHNVMAGAFAAVGLYVLLALTMSFLRFWPQLGEELREFARAQPLGQGIRDALSLRYLDGGGEGCTYPDEKRSYARRTFHHLTFYGFMLCFAATCVATLYHYAFGWPAPYPFWSLPVLLGTAGGVGLLIGPAGLLVLKKKSDPLLGDPAQAGMDKAFIALLFVTSLTGLLLLALRETQAMGVLLALHLGVVLALFLTLPYGKFVHALYRVAALVRFHVERRRPPAHVGSE